MWSFRSALIIVIAAATLLLTACPFPVPPHSLGTRKNIDDTMPAFIKEGVTTREDVLMNVGEPDSAAFDESWVMYVSGRSGGGIGFFMAAGGGAAGMMVEDSHYHRLIIKFDAKGTVVSARVETKSCRLWSGGIGSGGGRGQGGQSSPCLDVTGSDISDKYNQSEKQTK